MIRLTQARVSARALIRSTAMGSAVLLGLGAAYVSVGSVEAHVATARSERLNEATALGFSESALKAQAEQMAPGALAIAKRHDPYTVAGDEARDRDASLFAARLERAAGGASGQAIRVGPAAQPFQLSNALASSRELECLTQAVYYEARGEGAAGQAAVAQVVLNRVRHPAFPKTVCGVVFQGASTRVAQFSFTNDGSLRRGREAGAWKRAQKVAAQALDGHVVAELGHATHFHATRVSPRWNGMVRVASVGDHVFYRFGGRNGAPGAFRQKVRPSSETRTVYASILPTHIDASAALNSAQLVDAIADSPKAAEAKPASPAPKAHPAREAKADTTSASASPAA